MILGRYTVGAPDRPGLGRVRFRLPCPPFEAGRKYKAEKRRGKLILTASEDGDIFTGGGERRIGEYRYVLLSMLTSEWKKGDKYFVSGTVDEIIIERADYADQHK